MKNRSFVLGVFLLLGGFLTLPCSPLAAQMISPALDKPGEPFSYFSRPTDELGVLFNEAATEITPEGYLRTASGEMIFYLGPQAEPASLRIRTLEDGHLPIFHAHTEQDGIRYAFDFAATTLNGQPEGRLVNLIRIRMSNVGNTPTRAILATGIRWDGPKSVSATHGDNRFDRPKEASFPGDYRQPGFAARPDSEYSFDGNRFLRDGRALYYFSAPDSIRYTLHGYYNYPQDTTKPTRLNIGDDTAAGITEYSAILQPGQERVVEFKMPAIPAEDRDERAAIEALTYQVAVDQSTALWKKILAQGMQITLPEKKTTDTFDASLIYDLIAIDHLGPNYIQTVNKLHYHAFYLRDTSDIVRMYEQTGYSNVAAKVLAFFARSQRADGNFLSQEQQYDGWGETLWAYGLHYRATGDKAFAEDVLPRINRAVDWLIAARAKDPLHLMPASDVPDNEYVPGHLTGYNFLALSGLKLCIEMASATGHADLAKKWKAEEASYKATFLAELDRVTQTTQGYIPPALDAPKGGYDWGNLLAVSQEPILDAHDPRVTATLKATQAKYQEGIMTYANGTYLHHYLTIKNTLTEVIRGEQQQALQEFYALLVHTSSTHAGFEFAIHPWGDRNFADNLAPHGWFAAEYRTLLRNMLVREEGNDLHLLSVLSPEWIGADKTIAEQHTPTYFGNVDFTLEQHADQATLHLNTTWRQPPHAIVLHLPWFMQVRNVLVDGKPIAVSGNAIQLPANTRTVQLQWTRNPDAPQMSYQKAVDDYRSEYTRRYNQWMHGSQQ